jgi:hypothetical protein
MADADDADRDRTDAANRKRRMGPGEQGGGYASQRFDIDRHGGSYGGNEGAGGGHFAEPGGRATTLKGQQHMSGRYGDKAYGRTDGVTSNIPRDPSQHNGPVAASGGARPPDTGQNAQIGGGSPTPKIGVGRENERDAPGISTDKRSDDTKP